MVHRIPDFEFIWGLAPLDNVFCLAEHMEETDSCCGEGEDGCECDSAKLLAGKDV